MLRVVLGTGTPLEAEVVLLETNLDDLNPELVPDAVERCTAAGALDVWVVPGRHQPTDSGNGGRPLLGSYRVVLAPQRSSPRRRGP